jgi:hypothetical protein
MVRKPYEETNSVDGFTIRTFFPETKSEELKMAQRRGRQINRSS